MNDLERKLRQQTFREPPAELRAVLFGEVQNVIVPPCWTWRDWFWPSPRAWAALAALWLLFAVLAGYEQSDAPPPASLALPPASGGSPFFAFHHPAQTDVLELAH